MVDLVEISEGIKIGTKLIAGGLEIINTYKNKDSLTKEEYLALIAKHDAYQAEAIAALEALVKEKEDGA